jgi:hypothetical protein
MICMSFIPCRALINVNRNTVTKRTPDSIRIRLRRAMPEHNNNTHSKLADDVIAHNG